MSMQTDFDLIIIGGGCAGLSLANNLANIQNSKLSVLVVEARSDYINDRTWCFWDIDNEFNKYQVDKKWSAVKIIVSDNPIVLDCSATPYCMLSTQFFYNSSVNKIDRSFNIQLKLGTKIVSEPQKEASFWHIRTNNGSLRARMIVDTRPIASPKRNDALLWQSFYGYEIETLDSNIDTSCVKLMDFLVNDGEHIFFVYTLPIKNNRILIELTAFSPEPLQVGSLEHQLNSAIKSQLGSAVYKILRTESGILPMGGRKIPRSKDHTYVRIGVTAGAARSSTGYAFLRINRWAKICAESIALGGLPIHFRADAFHTRLMDYLFLRVLINKPSQASCFFYSLFKYANTSSLIRFLSGTGNIIDHINIVKSLPTILFLGALFRKSK